MKNPVGWVEIPVRDMSRAISFYNHVFGWNLEVNQMGELVMAWLPFDEKEPGASGSLCYHPNFYKPSEEHGIVIYFNTEDITRTLSLVESAKGSVKVPKTLISEEVGYMAVFIDSEGNRIALHSRAKK